METKNCCAWKLYMKAIKAKDSTDIHPADVKTGSGVMSLVNRKTYL